MSTLTHGVEIILSKVVNVCMVKEQKSRFLDASSHLYMSACLSVRMSVRMVVRPSVHNDLSETTENEDSSLGDASYYPPGLVFSLFRFPALFRPFSGIYP